MERFVHNADIEHYRRLIAESEFDPSRDEDRHKMLLTLLAEEVAKDNKPRSQFCLPPHGSPPLMRSAGPDSCFDSSQCQRG
jgi:hypothetical protein